MQIKFTRDKEAIVHKQNAIKLICSPFRSHEAGLPEWVKNSADAYARINAPSDQRVIIIIFQQKKGAQPASISCLDFVGMTTSNIEDKFRHWADPEAAAASEGPADDIQGGHGNGGKCYMTQMFSEYAMLHTVKDGIGNKYGFEGGDTTPGYFPDPTMSRNMKVSNARKELEAATSSAGVSFDQLPCVAQQIFSQSNGFTLVKGVGPKDVPGGKIPIRSLVDNISNHAQMINTLQICQVFVIVDGNAYNNNEPLRLEDIKPLPDAKGDKIFVVPDLLNDPSTDEKVQMYDNKFPAKGKLILKTSEKSMAWSLKYRHCIVFKANNKAIGFIAIPELLKSYYADRIYGECHLDILENYKQNDRKQLAESSLTRALIGWTRAQIEAYANEFVKLDKLKASQAQKEELSRINSILNEWKNQFIREIGIGATGAGVGPGPDPRPPRPVLPSITPEKIRLAVPFKRAGVNVALKPKIEFFDSNNNRVRSVPYRWYSSDWNIATVDDELLIINTHTPGEVEIWAETITSNLRSNKFTLQVVDIKSIKLDPPLININAGSRSHVKAICTLRDDTVTDEVYLIWEENDRNVVNVSSTGMVYAVSPGKTEITAGDDRCTASIGTIVEVTAALGQGGGRGSSYPQILLSEIDKDPLHEGQDVSFAPEEGPVCQRVEDFDANIWWINTACPLARRYLDESHGYGSKSREWRCYYLERYIESLIKIKLNHRFRLGEELSFDIVEQRWREVASEIQAKVVDELDSFIDEGQLPDGDHIG